MKKATVTVLSTLGLLILSWGGYLFRNDIFGASKHYHVLESFVDASSSVRSKGQIVLLEEAPLLRENKRKHIEEVFWRSTTLDSLSHYRHYLVTYYQESKYLTKDFKQGGQYTPIYSYWDNTMDWRNHIEDKIGQIYIIIGGDDVRYATDVYDYDFGMLVNTSQWNYSGKSYESLQELYRAKCKELGISN